MSTRTLMIYSRFERFWHWTQAALIFLLLFTGFAVHGLHETMGFHTAFVAHMWGAIALIVLWLFAVFWHLTTGSWRHYVPTTRGLWQVARFYAYGIFKGEHHPYRKAYWRKHNPLQALAYLALKLVLFPAIWITGLAYLGYTLWEELPGASSWLPAVAVVHTLAAFAILAFIIAHVYLLTTTHDFVGHVRPMVSGYDEVDLTEAEEAYLEESKAVKMK